MPIRRRSSRSPSNSISIVSPSTTRATRAETAPGPASSPPLSHGRTTSTATMASSTKLPSIPLMDPPCRAEGSLAPSLGGARHAREQGLFDLPDDLQRLVPLALPDVAAEDHARAPRLHHVAGVLQDGVVVDPGAAGEDDESAS